MLFLSQVLNGLGNALLASAYDAEYSKQTIHDLAGGWSIWEGVTAIVTGLAAASGGFIATRYGFSILMVCMTGMAVISFSLILLYVYREKAKVKNGNKLRG